MAVTLRRLGITTTRYVITQKSAVVTPEYKSLNFISPLPRHSSFLLGFGLVCSQTQLCHIGLFVDFVEQLHVSAFVGHHQVVLREIR